MQSPLEVSFYLCDMSAKFTGIYKRIWSPRFLPRGLAFKIEPKAM